MLGTASTSPSWLLVEEPGPWGPGGVPSSRLGEATTAALRRTAGATSARLLLVRRPGPSRAAAGGAEPERRTVFRVDCRRGQQRVLVRTCAPGDVAAAAADPEGWRPHPGTLLLVCTHGRKDWCCALRGRPVAAALAAVAPEETWECSHLGGDRFAANVMALPSGLVHGRVDAADAAGLAAALRAGRVVPRSLRGRCTDAMVVQAAEVHARLALGGDGADDLRPATAARTGEEETWRVVFDDAVRGGRVAVTVRAGSDPAARLLTCGADEEQHARTWSLVDLVEEPVA